MMMTFSHRAMATLFELHLSRFGSRAILQSVAFQVWEEVDRLEMMMSMHDPRAEIARVNREASSNGRFVFEVELFNVLQDCKEWASA